MVIKCYILELHFNSGWCVNGHKWVIESLETGRVDPGGKVPFYCGKGGTILYMAQSGSGTAVTHDPDPFWVGEATRAT